MENEFRPGEDERENPLESEPEQRPEERSGQPPEISGSEQSPEPPDLECPEESFQPEQGLEPLLPASGSLAGSGFRPGDTSEEDPSHKNDFHKSFWPTLGVLYLLAMMKGPVSVLSWHLPQLETAIQWLFNLLIAAVVVTAIVLRVKLVHSRPRLAKGFMWAIIIAVGIPAILLLLLLGSCMVLMVGF